MQLNNKTNLFIILGAVALGLFSFVFMAIKLRPSPSLAADAPSVGLLETSGDTLIVHAKSHASGTKETFVYCLSRQKSSDACEWDNSDEFTLSEAGDYYVYVKSLASGKISEPKLFTHAPVDSSQVKL